ncbi:hypothetical protein R6G69_02640 [Actinotignum urinale]|uniref:hypothetical protein n=1 Tax=Actinotignum urinale TaxID=190146 RepID=UPI002A82173C|nr:hypothetical protein [Actinotignum urinale]MDY5128891.1 hypothetical protein [Actinotignum urinale]
MDNFLEYLNRHESEKTDASRTTAPLLIDKFLADAVEAESFPRKTHGLLILSDITEPSSS